jgi:hypothetical protein
VETGVQAPGDDGEGFARENPEKDNPFSVLQALKGETDSYRSKRIIASRSNGGSYGCTEES